VEGDSSGQVHNAELEEHAEDVFAEPAFADLAAGGGANPRP
jgi:hypothetical protein